MKTLQELLKARAAAIEAQAALVEAAEAENRNLTEDEEKEFNEYEAEISSLDQEIQRAEAREERLAKVRNRQSALNEPQNRAPRPESLYGGSVQPQQLNDGGFKNLGEFMAAVRFGDSKGRLEELDKGQGEGGGIAVPDAFRAQVMPQVRNEWSMGTGVEGGFAVPERQQTDQILMFEPETSIVRPRAQVIPAGDPPDGKITIPAFKQGSSGVFGGVEVHWIAEGETKPETDGNLQEVSLEPHEVAAHTVVTDKLLRNWGAASTFIGNLLRGAVMATEDYAALRGNGVGKPIGVINSAGAVVVNRDSSNQIKFVDVATMISKLHPEALSNAIWVANQSAMPQFVQMVDAGNNSIFIRGDVTRGIPDTLGGIPIRWTGRTPALGTKGDLVLANFGYYIIKDGSGPFVAASEHVMFRQNKTVIKVFWNVDGKTWVIDPLTLEDGSTQVSPFVVLDVPSGG